MSDENTVEVKITASSAFASVAGMTSMVSARGGWDVPRDAFVNVHKNEMVLLARMEQRKQARAQYLATVEDRALHT